MPTLNIKVVPGARKDRIAGRYGDGCKLQVSAPPEDGKANRAVIELLAHALAIKPAQIAIVRGHTQARKVVQIDGLSEADIAQRLQQAAT